jgi:Zn-dependent protease/predicted transcriptional regulator
MMPSVRLGRIAGVPLRAHWSAFALPLLIADLLATTVLPRAAKGETQATYWVAGIAVAFAFLVSLCAHELAHAVTARRKGLAVQSMTLWMLGGITSIEGEAATPGADLAIAVVGPAASLVCAFASGAAAAVLGALGASRLAVAGAAWLAATNGVLAVFNMLPAAPLDGGRVLSALVWRRTGDRSHARNVAARAGRATGIGLVGLGAVDLLATSDLVGGLWLAAIGWFLMMTATSEAALVRAKAAFTGVAVGAVMDAAVTVVPSYQSVEVAARHAVEADADACPVVTFDGELIGIVGVDELLRAVQRDPSATVATVAHALPLRARTTRETALLDALDRTGGQLPLVVVEDGAIVGLISGTTINHALRRQLVGISG